MIKIRNHPALAFLVSTRFLMALGTASLNLVIAWRVYEITKDPISLGFIGLSEAIPALSLALFAGGIVDRFDPRNVFRISQTANIISFMCAVISTFATFGQKQWLYTASFFIGISTSFFAPCMVTMISHSVIRTELAWASSWSTLVNRIANFLGPALGGLLFATFNARNTFVIAFCIWSLSLVTSQLAFRKLHIPKKAKRDFKIKPFLTELGEGVSFVFKNEILLSALSLDFFAVFFGGVTALLPIFAAEILHIDARGLGLLRAAPPLGAFLMGFFLVQNPIKKNAGKWLLISIFAFGLCLLGFSVSTSFWLSCILLFFSGAFDCVSMVLRGALVQLMSPNEMRGRVASVNSIFIGSSNELGEVESGFAAHFMGTVPSAIFGSVMTLVSVLVIARFAPKLRNMEID